MSKDIINLTQNAYEYLKAFIKESGAIGIRINITSGGCQGLTYALESVTTPDAADLKVVKDDIDLYIAPKAVLFVSGMTMDYVKNPLGSNIVFENPNAKNVCGCGKSFCTSQSDGINSGCKRCL